MRARVLGCAVVGLLSALSAEARAKPNRSGFTGDVGAGFALVSIQSEDLSRCVDRVCPAGSFILKDNGNVGYALPSVSLGGFVHPRVAILARSATTAFVRDHDLFASHFLGPIVEVWPADVFYFSAGGGLAVAQRNGFILGTGEDKVAGWALDFRVGVAVLQHVHNDLTLSAELIPSFFREGDVKTQTSAFALIAAWKWY